MHASWLRDRGTNRRKTIYVLYHTCIRSSQGRKLSPDSSLYPWCTSCGPLLGLLGRRPMPLADGALVETVLHMDLGSLSS